MLSIANVNILYNFCGWTIDTIKQLLSGKSTNLRYIKDLFRVLYVGF